MVRLVGRVAELTAMTDVFRRASGEGRPGAVVVLGEPGSGKSRLLAEAAACVSVDARFDVRGYEAEQRVPLAAASEILRAVLSGIPPVATDAERPSAGVQLFEVVYRAVAAAGSVLLIVDDLQWIDEVTLGLCHYLLRGAEGEGLPLMALAAGRGSEATRLFSDSVARLVPDTRRSILRLAPLSDDESATLALAVNPALGPSGAADIGRKAAGSPFWIETLARSRDPVADIAAAFGDRMQGATADGSALVALISVMGRPLLVEEIVELLSWAPERVEAAAVETVRRGVLDADNSAVRFIHDLIRSAAEPQVRAAQRARLHRRISEWLEERAEDDPSLLLDALAHAQAAGITAVAIARRLASSPWARAIGLELVDRLAPIAEAADPDDPEASALAQDLAMFATDLGRHDLALAFWQIAAEHDPDAAGRARAVVSAAEAAFFAERPATARALITQGRALVAHDSVVAAACDVVEACVLRWSEHRADAADRLVEGALAQLRARADKVDGPGGLPTWERDRLFRAIQAARDGARMRGDVAAAVALDDELVRVAGDTNAVETTAAAIAAATTLMITGRLDEAEARLRSALSVARRRVIPRLAVEAGYWLTRVRYYRGDLHGAELAAEECLALAQRTDEQSRTRTEANAFAHVVRLSTGDRVASIQALRDLAAREDDGHYRIGLQIEVATAVSRHHGPAGQAEVDARLNEAWGQAQIAGCDRCWTDLLLRGADAFARVDRTGVAREWLAAWELRDGGERRPWRHLRATVTLALADQAEQAAALLRELHDKLAQRGLALEAVWARLDLAALLLAGGQPDEAVEILKDVTEQAGPIGAASERALAEQRLRGLGVRTWRRGRPRAELTDREEEIARMVVAGASNPEIAASLYLSRKTVERHVSNILAKAGARNRTELAARLPDRGASPRNEGAPR